MSKKDKEKKEKAPLEETVNPETPAEEVKEPVEEVPAEEAPKEGTPKEEPKETELEKAQKALAKEHDQYLRLAAEYDNFRKRSRKEKEALYTDIKAETVAKFLPVYDNLERALANETADEAYKKGVELIMVELKKIMTGLGVEEFGETGDPFDPNAHNAVMHVENEELGENVLAQVFQKGFRIGEKVIRHAVVQVAN
ncbi:MAG: nucleotide exchange factor GrpE [Oscillospiraceae bacterium]|jgi:molecular chaperone GrpE|nr:nucleotide exchange factor GrpE [Oscillospiraceae bacterium]